MLSRYTPLPNFGDWWLAPDTAAVTLYGDPMKNCTNGVEWIYNVCLSSENFC